MSAAFLVTASNCGQLETPDWLPKLGLRRSLTDPNPSVRIHSLDSSWPQLLQVTTKMQSHESHSATSLLSAGAIHFGAADDKLNEDNVAVQQPALADHLP